MTVHRLHAALGLTLGAAKPHQGKTLGCPREVLVTPPGSPIFETNPPFFIDWLSLSQVHTSGGLPEVDSGCLLALNADGVLDWKTSKAVKHEGSYETSLNVRCDGYRVTFSGNVSRFGRTDNFFGFDFFECIEKVNEVLAHYGLPPFTPGQRRAEVKNGAIVETWSGARVSRIDLTANFEAGSAENAHAVMQYLGSQHAPRQEGRVLGQGETVAFGVGSRRQYWKAYIKHLELKRHACADQKLIDHCESVGVVRFEGTIRSNALTDLGCAYLGDFERGRAMPQLIQLFEEKKQVLNRCQKTTDDLDLLPKAIRGTARDYLAGMDLTLSLSRTTFYRHRQALLPHGIDIAVRNIRPFQPRVKVVELRPAMVPAWYQLRSA